MSQINNIREHVIGTYRDRAQHYDITANLYYLFGFREWAYRRKAVQALRLRPGDTVVEIGCGTGLNFPLNPPGYLAKYVPTKGAVGFDMIRCPVAQVFRAQGAADLCRASWCDLDYALDEMQGLRLQRTTTLAEGADRCDFRLFLASQGAKVGSKED